MVAGGVSLGGGVYVGTATLSIVVTPQSTDSGTTSLEIGAIPNRGPEQAGHVASAPSSCASQCGHTSCPCSGMALTHILTPAFYA